MIAWEDFENSVRLSRPLEAWRLLRAAFRERAGKLEATAGFFPDENSLKELARRSDADGMRNIASELERMLSFGQIADPERFNAGEFVPLTMESALRQIVREDGLSLPGFDADSLRLVRRTAVRLPITLYRLACLCRYMKTRSFAWLYVNQEKAARLHNTYCTYSTETGPIGGGIDYGENDAGADGAVWCSRFNDAMGKAKFYPFDDEANWFEDEADCFIDSGTGGSYIRGTYIRTTHFRVSARRPFFYDATYSGIRLDRKRVSWTPPPRDGETVSDATTEPLDPVQLPGFRMSGWGVPDENGSVMLTVPDSLRLPEPQMKTAGNAISCDCAAIRWESVEKDIAIVVDRNDEFQYKSP